MLRQRWPIAVFVAWTLYVWGSRIVNAWSSSDESTVAKVVSTATAVVLIGAAVVVATALVRGRVRAFTAFELRAGALLAGGTILVWAVRVPLILLAGHSIGFKVVHAVLGLLSIALAGLSWRIMRRDAVAIGDGSDASSYPVSPVGAARR